MKQSAQKSDCAADNNVVVPKQKTAERGDTGRNDKRSARMRFT
jgi:hypothetical protein